MSIRLHKLLRGFSLLEALVVITIISGVATVSFQVYNKYIVKAKMIEGINILEHYQILAQQYDAKYDALDPFYALFPDGDTSASAGFVSGTPGNNSVKNVNLEYVNQVNARIVTDSGDQVLILGAIFHIVAPLTASTNTLYFAGRKNATTREVTWLCGQSATGNNVPTSYLPLNCINSLP